MPIYNAEKYLRKCLNSVINQTYKNIEILCINDGSTDNSLGILEEYAQKDSRIRIFNQKNSGPARARNVGLENANGDYLMFCDADDDYGPDFCKKMVRTICNNNVDLVMCNTNAVGKNMEDTWFSYFFPFKNGKSENTQEVKSKINVYLWNKIFKKEIIDKYNIVFPVGHKADDNSFVFRYLSVTQKVYFLDRKLYNHYDRENSIMDLYRSSSIKLNDLEDKIFILNELYDFLVKNNLFNQNIEFFKYVLFNEIIYMWRNTPIVWQNKILIQIQELLQRVNIRLNNDVRKNLTLNFIKSGKFEPAIKNLDFFLKSLNIERRYYCVQEELKPAYNSNGIPIVFNCDDNYVKYLSVCIQSIICNSSDKNNYDIVILNENISDDNKEILKTMVKNLNNFSIRFYDMKNLINDYDVDSWFTTNHINNTAYYRLFIPKIFSDFEKLIYLDSDLILQTDIYNLFKEDLGNNTIGAVRDFFISNVEEEDEIIHPFKGLYNYLSEVLGIKEIKNYFNSGVMLIDVSKIKNSFEDFINTAKINNRFFHDQNSLNRVLQGKCHFFDIHWNVQLNSGCPYILNYNLQNAKILHFCSAQKPWNKNSMYTLADIYWWQYAKKTPYYEMLLLDLNNTQLNKKEKKVFNILKLINNKKKIIRNYYRTKILSRITFGKKKKHYQEKNSFLKEKVRKIRKYR